MVSTLSVYIQKVRMEEFDRQFYKNFGGMLHGTFAQNHVKVSVDFEHLGTKEYTAKSPEELMLWFRRMTVADMTHSLSVTDQITATTLMVRDF